MTLKSRSLGSRLLLSALVVALVLLLLPLGGLAQEENPPELQNTTPGRTIYFPLVSAASRPATRIGFNVVDSNIELYNGALPLNAGWYLNWWVLKNPQRPNGIEFVQTVRIHQKLTCPLWSADAWNRDRCPYAQPYDYIVVPGWAVVGEAVQSNPGSLWLIGNEMDRRDWFVANPYPRTDGQDEMLPETYARAYHDLYYFIKSLDPTARIGIGGVIQATPLRLEYLTKAWDAYIAAYGEPMPVDVWNVHNFILRENSTGHGAGIPPGSNASSGRMYNDEDHGNMTIFNNQIRAFRQWMKDRGQQNKALIVSEYGILYTHVDNLDEAHEVQSFMLSTFDYFLNTKDCSLGYPADECRLVQRWAWYSLDDDGLWTGSFFNEYGALYNRYTKQLTGTGERYRDWVRQNYNQLVR